MLQSRLVNRPGVAETVLQTPLLLIHPLKATVENPRGSVEKLSPKESAEGADTVLRGSVKAPKEFSEGKPEAAKTRGRSPRGFAAEGLPEANPKGALTLTQSTVSAPEALF